MTTTSVSIVHRQLIIELAARHKLPAIYWDRFYVSAGGLISYGADTIDQCGRAAGYVDRILKGEKPADLPVQRDQVRAGHQPEDSQGTRPRSTAVAARPRRRGDRIICLRDAFAALLTAGFVQVFGCRQ